MFFNEGLKSPMGTVLENEVVEVPSFDNIVTFNYVGVLQLTMNFYFLLYQV